MENKITKRLRAILLKQRTAIEIGDISQLSRLAKEFECLVESLDSESKDIEDREKISSLAHRNSQLLFASLKGIQLVKERISDFSSPCSDFSAYEAPKPRSSKLNNIKKFRLKISD